MKFIEKLEIIVIIIMSIILTKQVFDEPINHGKSTLFYGGKFDNQSSDFVIESDTDVFQCHKKIKANKHDTIYVKKFEDGYSLMCPSKINNKSCIECTIE